MDGVHRTQPLSASSTTASVSSEMFAAFPVIKSKHSLVTKYVTEPLWNKLGKEETKTSRFTLRKAIACAVLFDDQHCGIYAGDSDSYTTFAEVFDPLIQEYHGISADYVHTSDMDGSKIQGNINPKAPVHSTCIRVGRSIDGFGLSPGITKEQRVEVENLMKKAFANLKDDLAGTYFPLTGMNETVRQQLVDDQFLFMSGDPNLKVAGMERDWPEGRGIFHNKEKTFLTWVNEEDQLRIISMEKGGDVKGVFDRLAKGIKAVEHSVKTESGKEFMLSPKYGYIQSCPTNLGTGMRASVHIDLPGWTKLGLKVLKVRCEELHLQPRGTRGESGGQTGVTYDISNKHRLGYSEVELVQKMIDGVNILYLEDLVLCKESFQCQKCGKEFVSKDNYNAHVLKKHMNSEACCTACGKNFRTSGALQRHLVNGYCSLQCDKCTKTFTRKLGLERHKKCCFMVETSTWNCKLCETNFSRKIDFERHIKHRETPDGSYKFFCTYCGRKCCNFDMLKEHIHSSVGKPEHIWKNFEDETKESFYWERLKKLSRKEEDLDSHMVDHKKEMLECENCRTKFRWKKNLRKHKNEACNSDGSWIHLCQICESQFCTGKLLKAHDISTHREFACSFCGKVFALKQNFDFHSKKRSPF
jgi:protein-arginine kinase